MEIHAQLVPLQRTGLFHRGNGVSLHQEYRDAGYFVRPESPLPGEPVIRKGCVNPFVGTALQPLLTRLGVSELALGGVVTNHVVESAARFAADSGYAVTVLDDLCASYIEQLHDFAIKNTLPMYARIATASEFLAELEGDGR